MNPETPTFNLKAVVQETGIKPDTLRAWERRYGLPDPQRSPGGHRLYSQRDVDILRWLMGRQKEGLSISRAVELWRSLLAEGRDPLTQPEYVPSAPSRQEYQFEGDALSVMRQKWLAACLEFDEANAERILAEAFALYPAETVCLQILSPGLREIGARWHRAKVSVQQEHFASGLAMRRIEALLTVTPQSTRPGRILMACPPREEHVFGLLLLQLLLRRRGYETIYLGANVPLDRMDAALRQVRPNLVLLSAQQLQSAASLLDMAELMAFREVPVAFGGRIFNLVPSILSKIPAHYLGAGLDDAVLRVNELIPIPPPLPVLEPLPASYRNALSHFQSMLPMILVDVPVLVQDAPIQPAHLAQANYSLIGNVVASLKFGDPSLLNHDAAWIVRLLRANGIPPETVGKYVAGFAAAVALHLGESGTIITDMLAQFQENIRNAIHEDALSGQLESL